MVSVMWAVIAGLSGLLVYFATPVVGNMLPVDYRVRIGRLYYKYSMKAYRKAVIVQRLVGGYEILPFRVDDEKKQARVTLSSGLASSDNILPFTDPADTVHRLNDKPLATVYEGVPAAVDPELCEWATATVEHAEAGKFEGDPDLEVELGTDLQVVEPSAVARINPNCVEPEWIETCEEMTEHRFSKYNDGLGATEALATFMGFAVGAGGVLALAYARQNLFDGSGGGGPPDVGIGLPPGYIDLTPVIELAVTLL